MEETGKSVPFILKTYELIETTSDNVIEWTNQGTSFVIKDPKYLEEKSLPQFFKHSNLSSFSRQLGFYDFKNRKIFVRSTPDSPIQKFYEYFHPCFVRDRHDLMKKIQRKTYGTAPRDEIQEIEEQLKVLTSRVDELEKTVLLLSGFPDEFSEI